MTDSLWGGIQWRGNPSTYTVGKEEPALQLHGPQLTPGPLASLQEYLPWPTLAPLVPLTPGRLCTTSSQPPPSAFSGPEMRKRKCHS